MKNLTQLLTDEERAAIRAPIDQARTLPRRAFFDPDFYAYEVEHVLTQSWFGVGFSCQLANTGDLLPLNILGYPIFLARGEDGRARAFHNVCPYDGCEAVIAPVSGVPHITAPYHGWHYALDGSLLRAGYWDGTPAGIADVTGLDADLREIPCHEWLNTLFIHIGQDPVPFETQYQPVIDHFRETDLERLVIGMDKKNEPLVHRLTINANWKTVYENYSPNVYHESFVHEMYRKSPHSPRVDADSNKTYTEINDPSGFLGLSYDNAIGGSLYGETRLPRIRNRDGSDNRINTIANVYPNWVTTVLHDTTRISLFLPEGPENGTQLVATMFDREGAHTEDLAKDRSQSARKGIIARKEDNLICESIQRARRSPAVDSQFYSPFWDAMHYTLTNLILDKLEAGEK